jgi:hypothetical protein
MNKIISIITFAALTLVSCGPSKPELATQTQVVAPATPTTSIKYIATNTSVPIRPSPPTSTITPTAEGPLSILPLENNTVERYGLLELDLQTTLLVENPYNPDEIDLRVHFIAPSGKVIDVGAFWYHGFDYPIRRFIGEPGWKARFTPGETGEWSAVAHIDREHLLSGPLIFNVVDSNQHGFVRINPSNPRYFAFDDGNFFFPIGMNMAWWSGAGDALTDYGKWMDAFAANGGNAIRVWMAEWSFGIEWNNTPLGNYDNRLQRAWLLDQIFAMAEERDIYILLVLLNCADFNNWQTKGWDWNPYNAMKGGPLERPDQFATDPTARSLLQRRLNYIVNRWGYSTHLLAWEWWNEVNLAEIPEELLLPWYKEMSAYLKGLDVNKHLITNSYAISDTSPSWLLLEMEIIQKHEYAHQESTMNKDLAERVVADLATLVGGAPPKPALLGEFGFGTESLGQDVDKTGIHLHNGLWATTFAGYAGSGMYWFWDTYVEAYRAWGHFKGLDRFLEGVDLAQYEPFSPLRISTADGSPGQAYGLGMRGEDSLVWIRSNAYTVQAAEAAWNDGKGTAFYAPPVVEGLTLTLPDLPGGSYTVSWFDPQKAIWLEKAMVTSQDGALAIPIPAFNKDLAARIVINP